MNLVVAVAASMVSESSCRVVSFRTAAGFVSSAGFLFSSVDKRREGVPRNIQRTLAKKKHDQKDVAVFPRVFFISCASVTFFNVRG